MKEKIGIVVAVEPEAMQFFEVFGVPTYHFGEGHGYEVWAWNKYPAEVYLIESGYGEIAAAAATQYLIDRCNVDKIINYGVVGGLHEGLSAQVVGMVRKIVHYGFDLSVGKKYPVGRYPNQKDLFLSPKADALPQACFDELPEFVCASADKFVGPGKPKRKLREEFGADVCEMEAAAIVITCNKNNVPCSFIKAVSDGVNEGEEAFNDNVAVAARACVEVLARFLT